MNNYNLETLYRIADRLGDRLAAMEMHNHDGLTELQQRDWKSRYGELEAYLANIENVIAHKEGMSHVA